VQIKTDGEESLMRNGRLPLDTEVVVVRNQISCEVEREMVVLHLQEGVYYSLNEVAARVWSLIQVPCTIREIRNALLADYDAEPTACTQDLLDLIDRLRDWKLIELKNGNSPEPS
jgi:hypothetical protein